MKALVKKEAKEGLWLQDVPVPQIGINDVLIKVLKTAICGTDVHIYNWDKWAQNTIKTPMTIGHEFVGEIVEMGSNVHDFKIGDIVSAEGHVVCGRCRNCLAGRRHLCHSPKGIGVNRDGAFAEFISVPVTNIWYCDKSIPLDVISCFDPLGNAVHTALTFNLVGEDVLITGAGPIGCMAAGVARQVGARHVVVTDMNPGRLELAKKMGATLTVDVRSETLAQAQQKLGMKEGFDVGMEMSGSPQALNDMLTNMAHGGKIALLGILPPSQVDWNTVIFNGLTLTGIYGRLMYETWYKVTMLIQGGLDISPLITHHFHYTEFEKGFEALRSGGGCKVVLNWA
ncbi:MAG TPA: L-threonine 3-dehydrogenase [Anaerohalosphaeraceae bacterium]|jgi:threonine 3-dehydrogenase|nr:L-threonine 3-dehydrogenase [Anaerohalosphaeraceae bacterium]